VPAFKPEDVDRLMADAIANKDLAAAVALYEPTAAFILGSGQPGTGLDVIRDTLSPYMDVEDFRFTELNAYTNEREGLALLIGRWQGQTRTADGTTTEITGRNVEVVRRQPDGSWLFVIDHPTGAN
jgi:ketosteroid isomerase-like protein